MIGSIYQKSLEPRPYNMKQDHQWFTSVSQIEKICVWWFFCQLHYKWHLFLSIEIFSRNMKMRAYELSSPPLVVPCPCWLSLLRSRASPLHSRGDITRRGDVPLSISAQTSCLCRGDMILGTCITWRGDVPSSESLPQETEIPPTKEGLSPLQKCPAFM